MKLAIIGAGAAGRTFAVRCARAGIDVTLEDVMPEKLRRAQDEYAEISQAAGLDRVGSLRLALTVEDAVHDADVAIDFVPDELESKLEIFSLLDRMAPPRTVICTPTEALSITDLASCTYRAEQCVALRGDLINGAVDVVKSRFASAEAVDRVNEFLWQVGISATVVADDLEPMLMKNLR